MTKKHAEKNVGEWIISIGWKKKHEPSVKEITPLCSASYELKDLTLQQNRKTTLEASRGERKAFMCWVRITCQFIFVWFIIDCLNMRRSEWKRLYMKRLDTCYIIGWHLIFFFFFKSLIFLTPLPKIVHPFAYLQCDNSAVWNNTLSRVYRWASLICCCDKTKICQHLGTRGRILTVIMNTQLVSLWWESYLPLLLHSTHVRQHLNIKY